MATKKWETEGANIDVTSINELLFRNNIVEEFVDSDNKFFIVASKGIGKTLLLKCKRYQLESGKKEGIIFIPEDTPYLDFVSSFGSLSANHLAFLSDWKNCKQLWEMAIEISLLSHYSYHNKTSLEEMPYLDEIKQNIKGGVSIWPKKIDNPQTPSFVLNEILQMNISDFQSFLDKCHNKLSYIFCTSIKSGMHVFIDRLDQALLKFDRKDIWISVQIGLIEASWDIIRLNNHIKIYTSMRQEAYANYNSPNKESMSGEVSIIKYSNKELRQIADRLSCFYEGVNSYYEFIGFSKLQTISNKKEDSFKYIHRHTIGRPRDIVSICSKLSPYKDKNKKIGRDTFRNVVNQTADKDIVSNVFSEIEVFLTSLKDKENRDNFLASIPHNVLNINELKSICRQFNGNKQENSCLLTCKSCKDQHPFCELYNVGLLGIINTNPISNKKRQKFVEPYETDQFSDCRLRQDSPYYLLHPAIHFHIDTLRNNTYGKKYNLMPSIIIGNDYPWYEYYDKLIMSQRVIDNDNISNDVKEKILDILKTFDGKNKSNQKVQSNFSKLVTNLGHVAEYVKIGELIEKLTRIIFHSSVSP